MSYTEHDETMGSLGLDGAAASDAGELPPGVSQEGARPDGADPAGGGPEPMDSGGEAGDAEEVTPFAGQEENGVPDPNASPPPAESVQADGAGLETPAEEKPKRKRVSRKKAAEPPPEDTAGETPGSDAQAPAEGQTASGGALDAAGAPAPDASEHDDDQDAETDAFVLSEGGEELPPQPSESEDEGGVEDDPPAAPPPKARPVRRTASAAKTVSKPKKEFTSKPLKDKPTLLSLDLNKLDHDLSEEERDEWNAIYASYRSKSILTGQIMGIDTHSFTVRNRETRKTERRKMLCAVIISYRVKVLIPETEVWYPGTERPSYVLHNMSGAEIDYTILDVDREGGVAIGSRRMAMAAQRHFFDTVKGGRHIGERLTCRVLAVGPRRCLVECGGRDMSLSQKDLTYAATPDLRTRYHPGQTLTCALKEYNRREGQFWVSVKDTVDNPFFGALRRHPIGSRRQAVISGKYGGGVFCTLPDETVCLCHYSARHSDLDFHVGDTVILAIKKFDYDRCLIYGLILSKW